MSLSREDWPLVPLAAAGAIQGAWRYYIKPELTAKRGWLAVGALVTAYELSCPEGELLSEGVDRAMEDHPYLVAGAIGITALHLANLLPEQIDPFHQLTKRLK